MDRGYGKFALFNRIVSAGSSYVCHIRDNSIYSVIEQRSLADDDRAARVISDELISLGSEASKSKPDHPVRLVVISAKPHKSKGRYGKGSTAQDCVDDDQSQAQSRFFPPFVWFAMRNPAARAV